MRLPRAPSARIFAVAFVVGGVGFGVDLAVKAACTASSSSVFTSTTTAAIGVKVLNRLSSTRPS